MAKSELSSKDYEKIGRLLESIVASGNANVKKLLFYNFVKGIAYGLGIFIAGTVVIGLVIWLLNLFDTAPLIGPFIQNITDYLQN
jgi:hypothetical protein